MSTGCREQVIELLKKYSLGSPLIDERMMDWLRLFYTYARVDLQAENAELKAENERLRMALADTEALEIGTAERCAKLTRQRDEYKADAERYRWLKNNDSPIGIYFNDDFDDCYYIHEADEVIDAAKRETE